MSATISEWDDGAEVNIAAGGKPQDHAVRAGAFRQRFETGPIASCSEVVTAIARCF